MALRRPTGADSNWGPIRPGIVQGDDGTIYFVEDRLTTPTQYSYNSESELVALDGRTGKVKFRMPLPQSGLNYHPNSVCVTTPPRGFESWESYRSASNTGPVAIGTDDAAYVEVATSNESWGPICQVTPRWCEWDGAIRSKTQAARSGYYCERYD